ncbi:g-strand binding protein [Kalmusia sp. IMI 367209]|nr:g-strand binding protein [Kalmusia sp. IMI 367209]
MSYETDTYDQRDSGRDRSPRRRSRSPRRSRRSYSPRSRSRSRDDYRRNERRSRSPIGGGQGSGGYQSYGSSRGGQSRSVDPASKETMMQSIRESSQQDRRVYVGNLSYDVKWHHLKDFMRQAGEVLFADVLLLPNGMSKGCGIVEYATREQAQNAVATLSNQNLMGRLVYVREDREAEPRFSNPSTTRGNFGGGGGGTFGGAPFGAHAGPGAYPPQQGGGGGRQVYVANLPYNVGWQDLKDLFRQAAVTGSVIRADVHLAQDGRPKGSGIVAFDTPEDARNAITQFNGYEWQGRNLEVREDRFAGPAGGYGGRGGFGGGFGGRGGFGGGRGADLAAEVVLEVDLEAVVVGSLEEPEAMVEEEVVVQASPRMVPRTLPTHSPIMLPLEASPATSFTNEDLVELFTTIGSVKRAEIQYEPNGRSRGTGVVEFEKGADAETAIQKFTGYQYGGRPLGLTYVRYSNQSNGDAMEGTEATAGLTQDQIM